MATTTSRLGLSVPAGADNVSAFPAAQATNLNTILDNSVLYTEGAFVSRPAAGTKGRVYKATDDTTGGADGTYYLDTARGFTATTTNTSTTLGVVSSFIGIAVGSVITGAGIPANTTVSSINVGASTLVMNNAATASGVGVSLTAASWNVLAVTTGGALTLPSDLTLTSGSVTAQASGGGALLTGDTAAGAGLKRSELRSIGGATKWASIADAGLAIAKTGASLDHASGVVDFPVGITESTRRGRTNIATTETRTNTAYGTMPTPDQVTVVLPTDGLIRVLYQATWQESVQGAAQAAIFIGANQLKIGGDVAAPTVQETSSMTGAAATDRLLGTRSTGLTTHPGSATVYGGDVTTGEVVGPNSAVGAAGPCYIFAAAGTYIVSVQFKASSGSVTAKNRKLWVAAEAYV